MVYILTKEAENAGVKSIYLCVIAFLSMRFGRHYPFAKCSLCSLALLGK